MKLGVSDGAVRQLLNRARNTLRAGVTAVTPYGLPAGIPASAGVTTGRAPDQTAMSHVGTARAPGPVTRQAPAETATRAAPGQVKGRTRATAALAPRAPVLTAGFSGSGSGTGSSGSSGSGSDSGSSGSGG